MKKVCILSIDGGGIRGILPSVILTYIEEEIKQKQGNDKRLSDYIDLFAGTSTGGILISLLMIPDEKVRPKFNAKDVLELYVKYGNRIFYTNIKQKLKNLFGIIHQKHFFVNVFPLPTIELNKSE